MSTIASAIAKVDPESHQFLLDPQAAFQDLYEESPVFFCEPLDGYLIIRYDDVKRVLEDDETYSANAYKGLPVRADLQDRIPPERERMGHILQGGQIINMDPPLHTWQRRAMQRAVTRRRVEGVKPDIAAISNELIDGLADRGSCDLTRDFSMQLTLRVIGTLLNLPPHLLAGFQDWIVDIFALLAPIHLKAEDVTVPDDQLVGIYERVYEAYLVYSQLLEERKANPGEDLASAMLALTDDDGKPSLTQDQVLTHMVGLTAAGTDTTAALIVNMVRNFTESPDQLQLVLDEPALWDNAVCEGLRRAAVAMWVFRIVKRDHELGGVQIPAGSFVAVSVAGANGDPAKFPDPLRFDVARENASEHLALGRARHYCLGGPLIPHEARIALQILYERLPSLKADLDDEVEFVKSVALRTFSKQQATWSV
jgi:cytochrome P450